MPGRGARTLGYRDNASLRRAAINSGPNKQDTKDDTARSLGTVFLSNFKESDEPAFMLGRSSRNPILAALVESPDAMVAMREWTLPPPFDDLMAKQDETVNVSTRCRPGLEAAWLQRPPQILAQPDGTSLAIFSRLTPNISKNWTFAKMQIATLLIKVDGTCPASASRAKEIDLLTTRPANVDDEAAAILRGREAFIRVNRAPLMLFDANGDGAIDAVFPEGSIREVPQMLCSLSPDGISSKER